MAWTNDLILCRADLGMRLHRGRRHHWLRVQCDYSRRLAGCPVVAHRVVAGGNRYTAGRSLTQKEVTSRAASLIRWRASTRFLLVPNVSIARRVCAGRTGSWFVTHRFVQQNLIALGTPPQYGASYPSYPAEPVVPHRSTLGSVFPAGGTHQRCAAGA